MNKPPVISFSEVAALKVLSEGNYTTCPQISTNTHSKQLVLTVITLYWHLPIYLISNIASSEYFRIYHECKGGIEKYIPKITVWHCEACRVMPNSDLEGPIFLSHPHTNNGFIFFLTIKIPHFMFKNRLPEVP